MRKDHSSFLNPPEGAKESLPGIYKEIIRLASLLKKEDIPFQIEGCYDGFQLVIGGDYSVIEHKYSYGSKYDLLEIKKGSDVKGFQTAESIYQQLTTYRGGACKSLVD